MDLINPQAKTTQTINEVQMIPIKLKWDNTLSLTKLSAKNTVEIIILKKILSTPVKTLKESANKIIMEIPANNKSTVKVITTIKCAILPNENWAISP